MLKVSEATKTAYKSGQYPKDIVIKFPNQNIILTNDDIVKDSMQLKECINTGKNLTFTGCIATCFRFECIDFVTDVTNEYVEASIKAGDTDEIPLFAGYVNEVTNLNHEDVTREIVAYDVLYKINNSDVSSWYNSLTFPITIRNMRNSFFDFFGVTQVSDTLDNDYMTVNKTIDDTYISGATIIKSICQINGRYGQIDRNGKFIYRKLMVGTEALYPRLDLFPANDLYPAEENALENINKTYYESCKYEDYRTSEITKVQLVNKEDAIVASVGSGTNALTISGNPLIYGKTPSELQSVAQTLYNVVHGLWYTPSKVTSIGLPYVECGDFVLLATRRSIVRFYCLERTLKGIQNLKDAFVAKGDELQPVYVSSSESTSQSVSAKNSADIASERIARIEADTINANNINAERLRAQQVEAQKATIADLQAEIVRAKKVEAEKATIADLNAEIVRAKNVEAQKATISDLQAEIVRAQRVETENLNASKAYTDTLTANVLNASKIYTDNLNTQNLNATVAYANQIKAEAISASQIYANQLVAKSITTDMFVGKTIQVGALGAEYGVYAAEMGTNKFNSRTCAWRSIIDGSGNTVIVLAGT